MKLAIAIGRSVEFFRDRSIPEPMSGCWLWEKACQRNGYGVLRINGHTVRAHRASFAASGVDIPSGVDVCHRCDVRSCVNPDHLFLGSRHDNMRDCSQKGRVRIPGLKGEALTQSKLTENDVRAIRADPRSNRALALAYGLNKGTIALVRRRVTWKHVT